MDKIKHKRGDIHSETGLLFWRYHKQVDGGEIWYTDEEFSDARRRDAFNQAKRRERNPEHCEKVKRAWLSNKPHYSRDLIRKRLEDPQKREEYNEWMRQWRKKHPERFQSSLDEQGQRLISIINEMKKTVSRCLGMRFDLDHIIPLCKGGIHHPSNIQIIPSRVNKMKGRRILLHPIWASPEFDPYKLAV